MGNENLVPFFDATAFLQDFQEESKSYSYIFTTYDILMLILEKDTEGCFNHLTPIILSSEPLEGLLTFQSITEFLAEGDDFNSVVIILPSFSPQIASEVTLLRVVPYKSSLDLKSSLLTGTKFEIPSNFEPVEGTLLYKKSVWDKSNLLSVPAFSEESFVSPFSKSVQYISMGSNILFFKNNQIIATHCKSTNTWTVNSSTNNNREFNRIPGNTEVRYLNSEQFYALVNTNVAFDYMSRVPNDL